MKDMTNIRRLVRNESGVTSIEYALIAVIIPVGIIVAVAAAGGSLDAAFADVAARIEGIAAEDAGGGGGGEDGEGDDGYDRDGDDDDGEED